MRLNEGPEEVVLPSGKKLSFRADDAYAFGYDSSSHEMKIGKRETHGEVGLRGAGGTGSYLGRLWLDDKVMVFWNYPDNYKELKILLSDLKQKFKEKHDLNLDFTKGWRLEVPYDPDEEKKDWDDLALNDPHVYYNESEHAKLIPLHQFEGFENISDKVKKLRQKRKEKHLNPGYGGGDADEDTYQYMKMRGKQKRDRYKGGSEERELGYSVDDPEFSKDIEKFREVVREEVEKVLVESPDGVSTELGTLYPNTNGAYSFGYNEKGEIFISGESRIHNDIHHDYSESRKRDIPTIRTYFEYPGRMWTNEKIISFWEYPNSQTKLWIILGDIEEEFSRRFRKSIDFNEGWKIEVVESDDYETQSIDWNEGTRLIPIEQYEGSGEWSEEEKAEDHMDPDIGAGGVDKGTYQSKKQKGKKMDRYPGGGETEKLGYKVGDGSEYSDELERFREVIRRRVSKLLGN